MNKMHNGHYVRDQLAEKDIGVAEFAETLGVARQTLSTMFERQRWKPDMWKIVVREFGEPEQDEVATEFDLPALVNQLIAAKDEALKAKAEVVEAKNSVISAKDELIARLEKEGLMLKAIENMQTGFASLRSIVAEHEKLLIGSRRKNTAEAS